MKCKETNVKIKTVKGLQKFQFKNFRFIELYFCQVKLVVQCLIRNEIVAKKMILQKNYCKNHEAMKIIQIKFYKDFERVT